MRKSASLERLLKDARRVLEVQFWIPELSKDETYFRIQDDHDSTFKGRLSIMFSDDGDAWVFIDKLFHAIRFRSSFGGGRSPRVRNALMLLAYAMKLDNEEWPQQ